jgi:Lipocalin-like domain
LPHLDQQEVIGAWKLAVAYTVSQATGQHRTLYGDAPRGYLMFQPSGRMFALLMSSNRQASQTEAGRAALFQSLMSYSGKFTADGDKFVFSVEIAWDPTWEGTDQIRYYTLTPSSLSIRTAPMDHPLFPGEKVVGHLEWTRSE